MVISSRNPFFNNFASFGEQNLLESLIVEAHSIGAPQMYYIPRVITNEDLMYTADDSSEYIQAFLIPMYIENFDRFNGDGTFMSKFNIEVHNQIQLSIAMRTFKEEIGSITGQIRPNEGDLIWFPMNKHCFQVRYVEKFEMFYPLGRLYVWQMTTELFEYSNETINTGIPDIDILQLTQTTDILDFSILQEDGTMLTDEADHYLVNEFYNLDRIIPGSNEDFQREAQPFINFDETDPFSQGKLTDV